MECAEEIRLKRYQESSSMMRQFIQIAVQILSFLALADVTILGFAINNKKASLFFICSIIMVIAATLHYLIRKWMFPYIMDLSIYEMKSSTSKYYPTIKFMEAFFHISAKRIDELLPEIEKENSMVNDRIWICKKLKIRFFPTHIGTYFFIWCGVFMQALIGIYLCEHSNWGIL